MDQRDYILERYPFADIAEEYAEVAAILWEQRALASERPNHDAVSLKKLENRIDAHIKGLLQDPELGRFFVAEALNNYGNAGETFVAAIFALESGNPGLIYSVLEHIANTEIAADGFISALAWLHPDVSLPWINVFLKSDKPLEKTIALAACGALRINPGDHLQAILTSSTEQNEELLLSRALRLTGELRRHDLVTLVKDLSKKTEDQQRVYLWANWSCMMLGAPTDFEQTFALSVIHNQCPDLIFETLFRFSPIETARKCIDELVQANNIRAAIRACCALGDPACLDWVIDQAREPASARIAGYTFHTITGLTLPEAKEPPGWADSVDESDDELLLESDGYDSTLPWPTVADIEKIWNQNRNMYRSGERYILGSQLKQAFLQRVYRHGNQHHRLAAALELGKLLPQSVLLNPRAKAI